LAERDRRASAGTATASCALAHIMATRGEVIRKAERHLRMRLSDAPEAVG